MLTELYHEWQSYPTILNFADQCALMRRLRQIPLAEIQQQPALFTAALAHIQISHQHNGLFELGEADAPLFAEFVAWVEGCWCIILIFQDIPMVWGCRLQ